MITLVVRPYVRRILVVYLAILVALFWNVKQSEATNVSQLLPSDIQAAASVDASWLWTNSSDVRSLPSVSGAVANVERQTGILIDSDLATWVGRVVVAKLASPEDQLRVAVFVEIRNSAAFENTLFKLSTSPLSKSGATLQTIVVDGRDVTEIRANGGPKIDFVVENNWLVVAYGEGAIDQLVSVADGSRASLSSNAGYVKALAKVHSSDASIWVVGDPSYLTKAKAADANAETSQAPGVTPAFPAFFGGMFGSGKFRSIDSFALIDKGRSLVVKGLASTQNPQSVAMMRQLFGGLSPITGASLQTVPNDASVVVLLASPGTLIDRALTFFLKAAPPTYAGNIRTFSLIARQYAEIYKPLTGEAALSGAYVNGSFGVNLAAATDSPKSAHFVEGAIVSLASQVFPALQHDGNEWTTWSPGASATSFLSPSIKTVNSYVELSTSHQWLDAPSGHFTVPFPREAAGSFETVLVNFKYVNVLFDMARQSSKSGNADTLFSVLEKDQLNKATFAAWTTPDPSGTASNSTVELNNFDWKKTLSDLIKTEISLAPPPSTITPAPPSASPSPAPVPLPPLPPPTATNPAPATPTTPAPPTTASPTPTSPAPTNPVPATPATPA